MHRLYVESEGKPPSRDATPKPCDYFDLIGGTGTGGLIAIMLGRLRLDLETCMDVYVKMTRRVFETDKTFAGIPYKHTLFKASKLEEAIRECVAQHTVYDDEGYDGRSRDFHDLTSPVSATSDLAVRRSMSMRSSTSIATPPARHSLVAPNFAGFGNSNATLYDGRETRTKTAVTAVYKGTNPRTGSSILLRSYDSRKEPAPEFNCTIWQAGRATCATGLAFKPIQIGQSVFTDEGAGKYNPAVQILGEANNEWPAREVGVFVSVGTGKRPESSTTTESEWWEGFLGGSLGMFAEARRRLIQKIEDCEKEHQKMLKTELTKRGVPIENYFRLNVDTGLANQVGTNEWAALSVVTTNTRKYLQKPEVQDLLRDSATRMAKIEIMKRRQGRQGMSNIHSRDSSWGYRDESVLVDGSPIPPVHPGVVELPVEESMHLSPVAQVPPPQRSPGNPPYPIDQTSAGQDKYSVVSGDSNSSRVSGDLPYRRRDEDRLLYQYQPPQNSPYNPSEPPPRPPKTPINEPVYPLGRPQNGRLNGSQSYRPPYPDYDDLPPPPLVSKLRKPEFIPRPSSQS
ncbi:hypothetical protein B0A52_06789 [Exophiala mesophila]|uniref:PNPLA domain-containing protein n=1 Tax=Exophiala mesophila TaxID=212818 RepID=A0A438N053_EXOME|nr:hypothetical protein B0A52_06789 [Exophiala mesophila]